MTAALVNLALADVIRRLPPLDWAGMITEYTALTCKAEYDTCARRLGVSADSLRRLGAGLYRPGVWAWPMYGPDGVCGIRLRSDAGKKWAVEGSKAGLFIPDGAVPDLLTEIAVVEGPTDCAAALDLGLWAIGRPSCTGAVPCTVDVCRGRDVVILADRDSLKTRSNGTTFRPGQEGATILARALHRQARSIKIVYPLRGKDCRAWLQAGATPAVVRCVVQNALEWKP